MSKQKIIQNNIEFLVDNVGGYLLPAKLTLMGTNSYVNYKVVNAVDIDWNEVDLGSGKISDTGLLIKEIKDLKDRPSTLKKIEKIIEDQAGLLILDRTKDLKDYLYALPQCITRDPVNRFYNNVFYDDSTTESLVLNYDTGAERIIKPFPVFVTDPGVNAPDALFKLYEDSKYSKEVPFVKVDFQAEERTSIIQGKDETDYLALFNLIPNKEYWYKTAEESNVVKSFKTSGVRRLLYIDKTTPIHNFRDLGGLKAIGGTIKYGKVIRGTHIDDITETGIAQLKALGINYELDLRKASEITANDLSSQGIELINTPFITFDAAILNTDAAKTSIKTAFEAFIGALNEDKNILVHCNGGKDRTGLFCFLLEALLGCSRDTIDKDYELSALYKAEAFKLNLRSANTSFYNYLGFLSFLNTFDGYTLLEKVRNYLILCGITSLYLDTIKLKLVLKEEFTNDDLNVAISKEIEAGVALDIPSNAASLALHALDYANLAADAADLAKDYAKAVKDYLLELSESQDIDATIAALIAENVGDIADLQAELVKTREKALGVLGNSDEATIQYEPYKDFVKYILFTSATSDSPDWNVTEGRKATSRYLDELAIPKGLGNTNIDKYLNDPRFSSVISITNQNRVYINTNKFKDIPIGFININSWALPLLAYNIYVGASNTTDDGAPNICLNWVLMVFNGLLYKVNPSTGGLMRVPDDYVPIEGEELFIGPASATCDAGIYTRIYKNNKWSAWKEYSTRKLLTVIDAVKTEIRNLDTATEDKLQKVNTSIEDTLKLARRFNNYALLTKTPVFHIGKYTTRLEDGVTYYNNDDMASITFPIGTAIQGFKNWSNVTLIKELVFKWNRDTKIAANHIVEAIEGGRERDIYYGDGSTYMSSYIVAKKIDTSSCSLRLIPANRTVDLEEDEVVLASVRWPENIIDYNNVRNKVTAPMINNYPLPTSGRPLRVLDIGNSYTVDSTSCLALIFTNLGIDTSNLCLYVMAKSGATYKDWVQIYHSTLPTNISIYNYVGGYKQNVTSGEYRIANNTWYKGETEVPNQLFEILNNNVWDLIVVHHSTGTAEISYYTEGLQELISIIRRHLPLCSIGTYIIHSQAPVHSTNLEKSTFLRWWRNSEGTKILLNLGIDIIIPYGTAIENLRTVKQEISTNYANYFSLINGNLLPFTKDGVPLTPEEIDEVISEGFAVHSLTRDNTHLGTGLARYTAACTYYLAIFAPYTGINVLSHNIEDLTEADLYDAQNWVEKRTLYKARSKKYPLMNNDISTRDSIFNMITTGTAPTYPNVMTECLDVNSYNAKIAEKAAMWACGDMHNVHNPITEPISEDIKSHILSDSDTTEPSTIYSDPSILYFDKAINSKTGKIIELDNRVVTGFLKPRVRLKFTLIEKTKEVDGEVISYNTDKYALDGIYIYDNVYNFIGKQTVNSDPAKTLVPRENDHIRLVIKPVEGELQDGDPIFEYIYNSEDEGDTIHVEYSKGDFNAPYDKEYFFESGENIMAHKLDCKYIYVDIKALYLDFVFRFFIQNSQGLVLIKNRYFNRKNALGSPEDFWGTDYRDFKFIGFSMYHMSLASLERLLLDYPTAPTSYLREENVTEIINFDVIQLLDTLDLLKRPEKRAYRNVIYNVNLNKLQNNDKYGLFSFVPVNTIINLDHKYTISDCKVFDANYNYLGTSMNANDAGNTIEAATEIVKKSKYYLYLWRDFERNTTLLQDSKPTYSILEVYLENLNSLKNISLAGTWTNIQTRTNINLIGYNSVPGYRIDAEKLIFNVKSIGIYDYNTDNEISSGNSNYWICKYFYINADNKPVGAFRILSSTGVTEIVKSNNWNSNILGFSFYCWCKSSESGRFNALIDVTIAWETSSTLEGLAVEPTPSTTIINNKPATNNRYIGAVFSDSWSNNDSYKIAHPENISEVNSISNTDLAVLAPYGNGFACDSDVYRERSLWLFELADLDRTFEGSLYSPYPKFHLNTIKVPYGLQMEALVTAIKLVDKNNLETLLQASDFKEWNSVNNDSTGLETTIEFNLNTQLNSGDVLVGTGGVYYLIYAKLTGYSKLKIEGTPGLALRVLYNRVSDNGYNEESVVEIPESGVAELSLIKDLNEYKSSENKPISYLSSPWNRKMQHPITKDWCDFCYDIFGETPVRQCSIVDFFASKGLTLKDSNGDPLLPNPIVSNMPIESYEGITLGWKNTNNLSQLLKQIDIASNYGLDYFIFLLNTSYIFDENAVDQSNFFKANSGLHNFLLASNSYKMKFCVAILLSEIPDGVKLHNLIEFIYTNLISKSNYLYVNGAPIICHYFTDESVESNSELVKAKELYKSYNKIVNIKILKNNTQNKDFLGNAENGVWSYEGYPNFSLNTDLTYSDNALEVSPILYDTLQEDNLNGIGENFIDNEPIEIIPVTTGYGNYNMSGGLNPNETETPTKTLLFNAIKDAINFAEDTTSEDKIISIYAWNEFCKGGNLLPKQSEVDSNIGFNKLQAVKEAKEYWESLPKYSNSRGSSNTDKKLVGALYFGGWNGTRLDLYYTDDALWKAKDGNDNYIISDEILHLIGVPLEYSREGYDRWIDFVKHYYYEDEKYPPSDCSLFMYFPGLAKLKAFDNYSIVNYLKPNEQVLNATVRARDALSDPSNSVFYSSVDSNSNYYRLPYSGWRLETVELMEAEIDLASKYGIDYFAFCFYIASTDFDEMILNTERLISKPNNACVELFLNARNKNKMKFCIIPILGGHGSGFPSLAQEVIANYWNLAMNFILNKYISSPLYLKLNGSAIVPIYQGFNGLTTLASGAITLPNIEHFEGTKYLFNYYPDSNFTDIENCDGYWRYVARRAESDSGDTGFKNYTMGYTDISRKSGSNDASRYLIAQTSKIKLFPIAYAYDGFIRSNCTENLFRVLEGTYLDYLDATKELMDIADTTSGDKAVLIYAWNEFGEGGYLPPTEGDLVVGTPEANRKTAEFNNQTYYIDKLKAIKDAKEYWLSK